MCGVHFHMMCVVYGVDCSCTIVYSHYSCVGSCLTRARAWLLCLKMWFVCAYGVGLVVWCVTWVGAAC